MKRVAEKWLDTNAPKYAWVLMAILVGVFVFCRIKKWRSASLFVLSGIAILAIYLAARYWHGCNRKFLRAEEWASRADEVYWHSIDIDVQKGETYKQYQKRAYRIINNLCLRCGTKREMRGEHWQEGYYCPKCEPEKRRDREQIWQAGRTDRVDKADW